MNRTKKKPVVFLMATNIRPEEKLLIKAFEKSGFSIQVFLSKPGRDFTYPWSKKPVFALIRYLSSNMALIRSKLMEQGGITTVNSSRSIEICSNKAMQALAFQRYGIAQPEFGVAFSIKDVECLGEKLGGDYVVKPVNASWGRGVTRLQNSENFEAWFSGRESLDPGEKAFPLLVQKYIPKENYDIRVVLVGKKPIVAFKRVSNHWKTNTHLGAKVVSTVIDKEMEMISESVIKVLGEGFYGLDLIRDKVTDTLKVCEVNHNLDFVGSSKIHGVDVAWEIAQFAQEILSSRLSYIADHSAGGAINAEFFIETGTRRVANG